MTGALVLRISLCRFRNQIHYNQGADLFTYLSDSSVFAVKDGHVEALQGQSASIVTVWSSLSITIFPGPGLGIEINEVLVRETSEKYNNEKAWRNQVWRGPDGTQREW